MTDTVQTVFGVPVGWVLADDETPLEVLGCVKYLDADGTVQHWVFRSNDLTIVEAAGMSRLIDKFTDDDLQAEVYLATELDDED